MSDRPWDRQPCDTDDSWVAFEVYRDSPPPRKLFARKGMYSMVQLMAWFRDCAWGDRVKAFDAWVASVRDAEFEAAIRETARERAGKHLGITSAALDLLEREVNKHLDNSRASELPVMKVAEITKMAEVMVKLDRLVKGENTAKVEVTRDLSKLTPEELVQLNELTEKAGGTESDETSPVH